jgi:hypothetical protein
MNKISELFARCFPSFLGLVIGSPFVLILDGLKVGSLVLLFSFIVVILVDIYIENFV